MENQQMALSAGKGLTRLITDNKCPKIWLLFDVFVISLYEVRERVKVAILTVRVFNLTVLQ
jgi:hypothetical protein